MGGSGSFLEENKWSTFVQNLNGQCVEVDGNGHDGNNRANLEIIKVMCKNHRHTTGRYAKNDYVVRTRTTVHWTHHEFSGNTKK